MHGSSQTKQLLNPAEAWWAGLSTRSDRNAAALLQSEAAGGRGQRSVYELFSEMEEKDAHLYSLLQTRRNGLLGLNRRIVPAAPADDDALSMTEFVNESVTRIPRFEEMLLALLDAVAKGFAVVELLWRYDGKGRLAVVDWIAHPQEYFVFSPEGELLLLSPPFRDAGGPRIDVQPAAGRAAFVSQSAVRPPQRKFMVLRFGADVRNLYGRGLAQHGYWLYWFKKNTMKFWAVFNEKHGSPTAVASYGPGIGPDDRKRLSEILDSLQTDSNIVIPETVKVSLLEAGRSNGASYREFLDWCNDEMSKLVLGATLTSGEGRRSGSLALGSIHQLVRQDYIDSDARLLEALLNDTLIRWICELNHGEVTRPRFAIETESPADLNACMNVDRALLGIGVPLPLSYFYERYGRPAPVEQEAPIRYDDANFYQYHLQFGILTVNEVRRRLNLPDVPWGDARTAEPALKLPSYRGSAEDNGGRPQ